MRSVQAHSIQHLYGPVMGRRSRCARRGFTLLEAILALTLMIILMAGVAGFYQTALKASEEGRKLALNAIQTRSMLERLAEEIRHTVAIVPGDGEGFEGTEDSITIVRARLPEQSAFEEHGRHDTLPPAQMDIQRVKYKLYWDEEDRRDDEGVLICYGVWRSEQKTFDPNPKVAIKTDEEGSTEEADTSELQFPQPDVNELYAPEIKYLRFEYFDGLKWRDRWNVANESGSSSGTDASAATGQKDNDRSLPQAVRITMGQVREPPPDKDMDINQLKKMREESEKREVHADRFTIVVYLPQSDQSLLSSRKKGAASDLAQMGEQTEGGK